MTALLLLRLGSVVGCAFCAVVVVVAAGSTTSATVVGVVREQTTAWRRA